MSPGGKRFFVLDDFNLKGATVFLRIDVNSPISPIDGSILDDTRFMSHLDTISDLKDSKLVIACHQSRPGKRDFTSLMRHSEILEKITGRKIRFIDSLFSSEVIRGIREMKPGDIIMLENTRFYSEEIDIDPSDLEAVEGTNFVKNLSGVFDYYVIDAFPTIHRAQVSLVGFRRKKPNIAGRLVEREVTMLDQFMEGDYHPKIAILAGSKIEDSINVAMNFLARDRVDTIVTGGVVANAFLWANGKPIGKRNMQHIMNNNKNYRELIDKCKDILRKFPDRVIVPHDFVLSPSGSELELGDEVPDSELIADIGMKSVYRFREIISNAGAIFLNGPMGMYEIADYSVGTREILEAVAENHGLKIAGGGHTLSALEMMGLKNRIDHASTGGGALISYLSGEPMPVLESLYESMRIFGGVKDGTGRKN
ncbi:MAG: phosphoglycerate kinase [Candidatus Thermoplasmatota archaeon]|nr:phosphoglycerate kinase [Candidatus Thermoplasmatota archaeon]